MILYIDDEPHFIKSYVQDLEKSDRQVKHFMEVDSALKFFRDNHDKIELVVLDIMMSPGQELKDDDTAMGTRTGIVLFPRLRALAPDTPVVFLTNVADDKEAEKFRAEPNCSFEMKKNFLPFELSNLVDRLLHKKGDSEDKQHAKQEGEDE